MPIAPITCKICERTEPCTVGWKLFKFDENKEYNICFECVFKIANQV